MNSFVNHLGLFAKFWEPGRVKTRLAATLGNQQACELYQVFLFHLLESVVSVTERTTVVFSPPEQQADFRAAISADWSLEPQTDGDLGDRMKNFFSQRLPDAGSETDQATKVIAIGADCPQLAAWSKCSMTLPGVLRKCFLKPSNVLINKTKPTHCFVKESTSTIKTTYNKCWLVLRRQITYPSPTNRSPKKCLPFCQRAPNGE